jgi:serine/threonine protein phosphatase PrpC
MRKVNQDNYLVLRDFAGIKDLYMIGVMDGHGVFGHTVSAFSKTNLPIILAGLIKGATKSEMTLVGGKIQIKDKTSKTSKSGFLPTLPGGKPMAIDPPVHETGDKWLTSD